MFTIFVNNRWVEVTNWVWRSWSGERRLNGKNYYGPVYFLGTNDVTEKT